MLSSICLRFTDDGVGSECSHVPLDYETVSGETPDHVEPAYDMMRLEFDVDLPMVQNDVKSNIE